MAAGLERDLSCSRDYGLSHPASSSRKTMRAIFEEDEEEEEEEGGK